MINDTNDIKVSVCVVTYNQEKYIAECLDSLVSQETDFKFEIIVGEDCSTDGTRAIVQQYVDKYPDIVKPIFHKNNVGAVENVKQVYIAAKGKYIAHMDGDDMALPNKLQKQFDTLEAHPNAIICSHNMLGILNGNILDEQRWYYPEGDYGFLDLIKNLPFFAHSSKFFRVVHDINLSAVLRDEDTLDIELHLHQSLFGSILHLEDNLGCYRFDTGISSVKENKLNSKLIKRVEAIYDKLSINNPSLLIDINRSYAFYLLNTAYGYAVFESNSGKLKEYTIKSIKKDIYSTKQIVMLLLVVFPNLGVFALKNRYKMKHKYLK